MKKITSIPLLKVSIITFITACGMPYETQTNLRRFKGGDNLS